jgi:hypothetical protein
MICKGITEACVQQIVKITLLSKFVTNCFISRKKMKDFYTCTMQLQIYSYFYKGVVFHIHLRKLMSSTISILDDVSVSLSRNTMDATSGAGTTSPSGSLEFTLCFSRVRVAQSLVFCVVFCRPLSFCFFFSFGLCIKAFHSWNYVF